MHAFRDAAPSSSILEDRAFGLVEILKHQRTFLRRFFLTSQFKRTCVPNAPKVGDGGSLSPRGDWRAPSRIRRGRPGSGPGRGASRGRGTRATTRRCGGGWGRLLLPAARFCCPPYSLDLGNFFVPCGLFFTCPLFLEMSNFLLVPYGPPSNSRCLCFKVSYWTLACKCKALKTAVAV